MICYSYYMEHKSQRRLAGRRRTGRPGMTRLRKGDALDHGELTTIHDSAVQVPDAELLVHLQFRRYAGCPVCNLHLRSVAGRHNELVAAGIGEVVVFHSTAQTMLEFQGQLPFAAIADPAKKLYAEFGVEKMPPTAALNPRSRGGAVWWGGGGGGGRGGW